MEFVEPWYSIEESGGAIADSLVDELKRELSEKTFVIQSTGNSRCAKDGLR